MRKNYFLFIFCFSLLTALGCKKEEAEITGCRDKDAENYNASANVDGDCVYARDKFIGTYKGTLTCPGGLSLISGQTDFNIDENLSGGKNDVTVLITTTTGLVVPVTGTCSGNKLSIDALLKDLTITLVGSPVRVDITAKGEVTYTESTKTLSGSLNLITKGVELPIELSDTCPINAIKQ